jgi:hypothetical protein
MQNILDGVQGMNRSHNTINIPLIKKRNAVYF